MAKPKKEGGNIIIRREEVVEGGHHGGAWKVAYADFVTAMMAFFLLMWLLNATTEVQRKGIADYFTPANALSHASSGSGKIFGGRSPFEKGEMVSDRGVQALIPGNAPPPPETEDPDPDQPADQQHPATPPPGATGEGQSGTTGAEGQSGEPNTALGNAAVTRRGDGLNAAGGGQSASAIEAARMQFLANATAAGAPGKPLTPDAAADAARRERAAFDSAAEQIRDAVRNDPGLAGIMQQLAIDQTPEGLRIQLLDEDRLPMFATGSAAMGDRAKLVLQKIAPVLAKLSEAVSIAGHTDAAPFKGGNGKGEGRSNWDLSAERANTTRRLLVEAGLQESRVRSVTGNADRDLLLPADPLAAANRRIAIVVLRNAR